MTEQGYPPPPPPVEYEAPRRTGFHGPETHIFKGIRTHLTQLEIALQDSSVKNLRNGLLLALLLGAVLSFLLSFAVQTATGLGSSDPVLIVLVAPLSEEPFKALNVVIVAFLVWKTIPSRRHGALLGAASGLGFAIAENILYSINFAGLAGQQLQTGQVITSGQVAELIAARWFGLPFMHVLWSAIVGVGIFVLFAQVKGRANAPGWLALPFLAMGTLAHMCWNGLASVLPVGAFPAIIIDILVVFTPFAFLFRDFIGGHFNFRNFLEPVQEPLPFTPPQLEVPQPPPPPPM